MARMFFNNILVKDFVAQITMIEGSGTHGLGFEALKPFGLMRPLFGGGGEGE